MQHDTGSIDTTKEDGMPPKAKTPMVDINSATREELVEIAGLPEATAEAILERRDAVGSFVSHDALQGVAGVTDSVLDQIRSSTRVIAASAGKALETGAAVASSTGEALKSSTEAAARLVPEGTERSARIGRAVADNVSDFAKAQTGLARELEAKASDVGGAAAASGQRLAVTVADEGAQAMRQTAQVGAAWFSFWPEQMREGWQAAMALSHCRSVPEALQIQAEFWRKSLSRSLQLFGVAAAR
jgi:hypothetical protein